MKSVLLIGMGKFGRALGQRLLDMGDQVMIIDKNEEIINELSSTYAEAIIANCTKLQTLSMVDVPSFDVCIVAIGDDFQSSLETTSILKELGAKRVISKASTEIQKKFLLKNGADEVIYPTDDLAEKIAIKINSYNVDDFIELNSDYGIFKIATPENWVNKSVMDINPRKKFDVNILTIEKPDRKVVFPDAKYVFKSGDKMWVCGHTDKIIRFANNVK
ncbi:MAG: TrkA family potassium uptake protein [Clostridiales bacterium]|nr:TrkA family potassium uptake protein [Clostridiales bacterium]